MQDNDILEVERFINSFPEEPGIAERFGRIKKVLGDSSFTVRSKRPVQQRKEEILLCGMSKERCKFRVNSYCKYFSHCPWQRKTSSVAQTVACNSGRDHDCKVV